MKPINVKPESYITFSFLKLTQKTTNLSLVITYLSLKSKISAIIDSNSKHISDILIATVQISMESETQES